MRAMLLLLRCLRHAADDYVTLHIAAVYYAQAKMMPHVAIRVDAAAATYAMPMIFAIATAHAARLRADVFGAILPLLPRRCCHNALLLRYGYDVDEVPRADDYVAIIMR